jgi:hypothetical protein
MFTNAGGADKHRAVPDATARPPRDIAVTIRPARSSARPHGRSPAPVAVMPGTAAPTGGLADRRPAEPDRHNASWSRIMMEVLAAPDHVAAYHFSGTLTEADLERVIADVDARLARHDRIAILADLTGFEDVTLRAGLADLRYGFSKLGELRRFPREAVITDKAWIASLVEYGNPLIPFVEIRAFRPEEREAALAWASEIAAEAPRERA